MEVASNCWIEDPFLIKNPKRGTIYRAPTGGSGGGGSGWKACANMEKMGFGWERGVDGCDDEGAAEDGRGERVAD